MDVDLDYLQDWPMSLQSQYLLLLRSHKDGEDAGEREALWGMFQKTDCTPDRVAQLAGGWPSTPTGSGFDSGQGTFGR